MRFSGTRKKFITVARAENNKHKQKIIIPFFCHLAKADPNQCITQKLSVALAIKPMHYKGYLAEGIQI